MKTDKGIKLIVGFLYLLNGCAGITTPTKEVDPTVINSIIPKQTDLVITAIPQATQKRISPIMETVAIPTQSYTPQLNGTSTLIPSVEPTEAAMIISELMQTNSNCSEPCFWGMKPGVTELDQAIEFLISLGRKITINDNQYYTSANIDDKISINTTLSGKKNTLVNIRAGVNGLDYKDITTEDWAAFRPDNILRKYGVPDEIGFFLSFPTELTTEKLAFYDLVMVYNTYNFIITYYDIKTESRQGLQTCILDANIPSFDIWLGREIENTPIGFVPLDKAAKLSVNQFYDLLTDDLQKACFNLYEEAFTK